MTPSPPPHDCVGQLKRLLGGPVLDAFSDPSVENLDINPSGRLYLTTRRGSEETPHIVAPAVLDRVVHLLADYRGIDLAESPLFGAEFPMDEPFRGARIQATLPPTTPQISVSIRIHAPAIFTLPEYEEAGILSPNQHKRLCAAIEEHHNILVIGGTLSGKTTLLNALLREVLERFPNERILTLEDTRELQVSRRANHLPLQTKRLVTLQHLVAASLRMNPLRLIVGEVRGGEALDLIDAWSTGHRGGFATLHAEDCDGALLRLERLARRHPHAGRASLRPDIAAALDLVVEIQRRGDLPRVLGIYRLASHLDEAGHYLIEPY